MTKKTLLIVGLAAAAGATYWFFFRKPTEKKSNASGTTKTVGPCSGSGATPEKCQSYCEETLGGVYNSDRTCTYSGKVAPGPLFGNLKVITSRKVITA